MATPILITTTFENEPDAERLARMLLEQRLVACARISVVGKSMYWWQGQISETKEYELGLKSTRDLYPEIEALIRTEHPYETPEIVATAFVAGSAAYLAWLEEELRR
ncbi:divalent-cation tolerance protein CutA [Desulfoprunum benzoelyticum]|uniref:Periplasmic divalent cation tolerance protein n=1 Tax=Desulfoprunum benzoelyticum TaxID=1506996 RepID=A0A840UL73_9BACT|nr:divalent-cation tolerance protein CutA [Desulfoprunum benzoelyticum]MBB5346502.1 periplasmic divalent cation tolerance protein [Desulfoprunum benzoelyticum]MBM9528969.1 divalent-cation tolerance protein CutA [Desulfoprunum benzoelyticum]